MNYYMELLGRLESELEQLESESLNIYGYTEKGIALCKEVLGNMRENVIQNGFKNINEECTFFKVIKPKVVGYLIHFMNLLHIERYCPIGSFKKKQKFYTAHIAYLRTYFLDHPALYDYYIRNLNHLDREYFTRNQHPLELYPDSILSIIDVNFSTAKDMVFAQINGNLKTIEYLKGKMMDNNINSGKEKGLTTTLKWTGQKVDLVELVYALHSSGSCNHGRADLKEIAEAFEAVMHVRLGDYYRTFLEIRNRKIQATKFLDCLKDNLKKRMVEADG